MMTGHSDGMMVMMKMMIDKNGLNKTKKKKNIENEGKKPNTCML